jgi:RNA polymerase sigma factor for flagellar operon FliA
MENIEKRNEIILEYYNLIEKIANDFIKSGVPIDDFEDLCQEGVIGLIESLNKYDLEKGYKLSTFCHYRIKGAMLDYLRKKDTMSRYYRFISNKRSEFVKEYIERYHIKPSNAQIAEFIGMDVEKFENIYYSYTYNITTSSIEEPLILNDGKEIFIKDILPDKNSAIELIEKREEINIIIDYIYELSKKRKNSKRDIEILNKYFIEDKNMYEIAELYKITESRVSQIILFYTEKIKKKLILKIGEDYRQKVKKSSGVRKTKNGDF